MARPAVSWLFLLLLPACATPARPPERGQALFDGRSLAGWRGDARFWRVEDGALVGESTADNPCASSTYLVREGEFGDFELTLRFRIQAGNSGVQFRSRAPSLTTVAGYQADLEAGPDWTGGLYEQDGRGIVTRRGERVVLAAAGEKHVERFADGAALLARAPAGAWNELVITALGPRLTLTINGELFSETFDLDPAHAAARGSIALQLHAGPPMKVEFRDLVLRELAPAVVEPPDLRTTSAPEPSSAWSVDGDPHWIWPVEEADGGEVAWFRREFELPETPRAAELWIACDNRHETWLNGTLVATGDDWYRPERFDVTSALRRGTNELLVRGENEGGPAALALWLAVEHEAGARFVLESDTSFASLRETPGQRLELAAARARTDWSAPHVYGGLVTQPWSMAQGAEPAAGIAPEGAEIKVPPGFVVERIYSVPMESQGSWVSLTVDPRGRLYASDQYGELFRVTLQDGSEPRVEPIPVPLGEAHGLLWAHDSLYVVVNHGGEFESGLWRVRDTDGDDQLDSAQLLRAIDGDGEHGPHSVVLDRDGEHLILVGGNHTKLPGPIDRSRLPANWREDSLLPLIPDPGGHAVGVWAPGGWIVRTDRDGKQWELIAAGFRNAYDLAFNRDGELFTYDSDMEWDVGMPWYRPTRVCHVVSGAEFGWRNGSSKWPADSFDSLPAAVNLELGSPTGIVFGTGTNFPSPWREALFACDWAYGRIFAVHLAPQGASYTGTSEIFASGQPFPVTDIVVGADGALYVTIGGRQSQSGLYRIAWSGAAVATTVGWPERAAGIGLRQALESYHGVAAPERAEMLVEQGFLAHEDPFVRYAARIALESQPSTAWARAVEASEDARGWLEGALARVRCDAVEERAEVLLGAAELVNTDEAPELRLDATRVLELALLRLAPTAEEREAVRVVLDPLYPSGDARLDRALLGLLVHLEADVSARALDELARAETQEARIAILYALRAHAGPWTVEHGERALALMARERETARGGASVRGYLDAMTKELEQRVGAQSKAAPTSSAAASASAPRGGGQPAHAWTLAELEPHLDALDLGRDFANGARAFAAATCLDCHRFHGQGQNQGPDLSGVGGRYSGRDFLRAILEPSREVPDVWRDTEFWSGEKLLAVGRLEAETEAEVVVRDANGKSLTFARDEVSERRLHALSRMPANLLDTFTLADILDLAAYALSSGNPTNERFTR